MPMPATPGESHQAKHPAQIIEFWVAVDVDTARMRLRQIL